MATPGHSRYYLLSGGSYAPDTTCPIMVTLLQLTTCISPHMDTASLLQPHQSAFQKHTGRSLNTNSLTDIGLIIYFFKAPIMFVPTAP